MAARKKPFHPDEIRKKIQTSQLINRLQSHVNAPIDEPVLSKTQIQAINILLRKVVPDLSTVTLKGDADNPLEVVTIVELVAPGVKP